MKKQKQKNALIFWIHVQITEFHCSLYFVIFRMSEDIYLYGIKKKTKKKHACVSTPWKGLCIREVYVYVDLYFFLKEEERK